MLGNFHLHLPTKLFLQILKSIAPNIYKNDNKEKTVHQNGKTYKINGPFAHDEEANFEKGARSIWTDFSRFEKHDTTEDNLNRCKT